MSPEALQGFFESTAGQITSTAVLVLLFAGVLISGKNQKRDTRTLVTSALLVALSIALNQVILFRMPQGGSITAFSMMPIVLCAYFFGVRRGVMAGMCVGMLDLIFNPYVIHPVQMILDYPMAFGALGFGAFVCYKKGNLIAGFLLGLLCRYICAVLSGIIFFGAYAPEGFNAITWSVWYNLTYLGVEGILTIIILSIPAVRKTFKRMKSQL